MIRIPRWCLCLPGVSLEIAAVYESRRGVYSAPRVTPRASGARPRPPSLVRLVLNMRLVAETQVVMIAPPTSKVSDSLQPPLKCLPSTAC